MLTVGKVTSPVTQVAVVEVNNASIYGTEAPVFVLIGNDNNKLPIKMATKKLSKISCVVLNRLYLVFTDLPP